jgi:RNA polymerase sigma-70 factor, ECF subfamily
MLRLRVRKWRRSNTVWNGALRESLSVMEGHDSHAREFVRLLAACERRLDNYVLTLVPNWSDAEDIVQQVKLRLWEQFEQYDYAKDFGAWACTVAYYEVLSFRTRMNRSRVVLSQSALDRVSKEADNAAAESDSRIHLLKTCMEKLTQWQRELLLRCCAAGESVKDVALELDRKVDSVRKAVLRIRHELFRCVEDAGSGGKKP